MRKLNLKSKGLMSVLFLAMVVFSQCKKEDQSSISPDTELQRKRNTTTTTTVTTTVAKSGTLDVSKMNLESGFAYYIDFDFGVAGDSDTAPTGSTVKIFENGVALNPAHTKHADIRTIGKGRFSHWGNSLYFSTSDNSNPKTNGRKYTYTTDGSTPTSTTTTTPTPTPTPTPVVTVSADTPIGYAMVDGSTTGGKGGQTVTVTNLTDFRNAAKSSLPMIIYVSGNFTGTGMIDVLSNKTIIGLNGATLNGIGLALYRSSNIIIKNMKINKVVGYDCITIKETTHHVWVDHCELWADRNNGWDYYDELLEVTDRSDYVTISNTIFHDTNIAFLIGGGDYATADIGHLKVTMYGNYFYNVSERQPCTRFGFMHVFNNYILNGSGYGVGVTMDATVRVENNYFENQSVPIRTTFNLRPGFVSGASTNFYKNCGANQISTSASNWIPPYEYQSVLLAAADVPAKVLSSAGPKY